MTCAIIGVGSNVTLLPAWPAKRTCLVAAAGPVCNCDWPALKSFPGSRTVQWPGFVSGLAPDYEPGFVALELGLRVLGVEVPLEEEAGCRRGPRRSPEHCLDGSRLRSIRSYLGSHLCSYSDFLP